ncbi:MAG: asparagine synthetase B [Vicinamibacterales bacterium]
MSGLGGVLYLDAGPATAGDVSPLLAAQAHRGPDGTALAVAGSVALGVARLRTMPDHLDIVETADGLVAAMDGCVDDRRALAETLNVGGAPSGLELILEGYRRWGIGVVDRLVGECAVVLWDARLRRLVLFRDVIGMRPLCYRVAGSRLLIASEPQALARTLPTSVNEGYLAEHLADDVASRDETLFRDVYRVPPGDVVLHERGRLRRSRYWHPAAKTIRYRRPDDYLEHFRELFGHAVEDRLPATGAALTLSGGIDSSIVAAEVAAMRADGHAGAAATAALTLSHPGRPEDETGRAAETAARLEMPWRSAAALVPGEEYFAEAARRAADLPEPPTAASARPLRDAVRASGHRVVLTGYGGDEWFSAHQEPRHLRAWHRAPAWSRRAIRRLLGRSKVPAWIDRGFAARVDLARRLGHWEPEVRLPTGAATRLFHGAMHGELLWRRELAERLAAWAGFEERSPLFDRRVVEFACALPNDVRARDGVNKWILRRAYRAVLPPWAANPPAAAGFNWIVADCLQRFGGIDRVERSAAARNGWLDSAALRQLHHDLEAGNPGSVLPLWNALAVSYFLDSVSLPR